MTIYQGNQKQILKISYLAILAHVPLFFWMAHFFGTEKSLAVAGPLVLAGGQWFLEKITRSREASAILMGFSLIALSALMIHLGKGMIEWHFHIFIVLAFLSLFASPKVILAGAVTAAVHHVSFFYFLPESVFNYDASLGIVIIHAVFVVVESAACIYVAKKFFDVMDLQEQISSEISPVVESIDCASKNSAKTVSTLLEDANHNSSALTELSAAAVEISSQVNMTKEQIGSSLERMEHINVAVTNSSSAVDQGTKFFQAIEQLKIKMGALQEEASSQLGRVEESVNKISDKTLIINDIVFQTKLLSFNASVEAARAGEHGKGFAVVAEEIGNLASTSGVASGEIRSIVEFSKNHLNSSIASIVSQIEAFQKEISETFSAWDHIHNSLHQSFREVEGSSSEQSMSLHEISRAADHQVLGVKELSDTLSLIDEATNRTLVKIREVESTAVTLENDSKVLLNLHKKINAKAS